MFFHDRPASAADEECFEKDLERQLEDELQLDELKKHRQETDKTCMVRLSKTEIAGEGGILCVLNY